MCGATSAQKAQQTTTASAYNTAVSNAQSVFGASSTAFKDLMSTFAPTVAAGPSQNGFSGQTLSNLNSSAITQVGQEAKNEKAALGNSEAATGGGTSDLPSGGTIGANLSLAENAGNQTASELSGIQQADVAQGNANYKTAVAGLEGAPGVFNAASSATGAATGSGDLAGTAANSVAQANQSGWQLAAGALGGVAGAALGGGGTGALINAFSGGNSTNAATPGSTVGLQQAGNNVATTTPSYNVPTF